MRARDGRKTFATLLAGKMLGVAALLGAVKGFAWFISGTAYAQAADPVVKAADIVNPLNTVWVLLAAFLVFFMQAGFMLLEVGFARTQETVNILQECIVDTALCGLLFFAFGFAFMFGEGNKFIGTHLFFLQGGSLTYGSTGVPLLAFFLFQFAFADTCSTITSGAMVGRTRFSGDLFYSIGVSGFIYPILGHWCWGPGGWLGTMGSPFRDFAGSMLALTGAIALGPRIGRVFKRDGGGPMVAHNMTLAAVGGVILWFGWYGFNPGSTLSAMDAQGIGRVATNTTLAASAGTLTALFVMYRRSKLWDTGASVNGFLAGLVAITCPCYWVSPVGAIAIGAVAGVVMLLGVDVLEWFRIDDPIGAVAVHGFAGIWGTLSLGLFAAGKFGAAGPLGADNSSVVKGLFYGGGVTVLKAQAIGSFVITVSTLALGFALMYGIKATGKLRVSEAGELEGLDLHEHGTAAYHVEFGQGMTYSTPANLPGRGLP
jgi:Amt family ammonium transporter